MTEQEKRGKVIKGLECCIYGNCEKCDYEKSGCLDNPKTFMDELKRDALALLKAQEPVKPIPMTDDDWVCGSCSKSVVGTEDLDASGFVPVRFNFCPNCGRAVKWE